MFRVDVTQTATPTVLSRAVIEEGMPSNYDVTVDAINVPGRSLIQGANVGVQDTVEPGSTYTVEASVTINEVPGIFGTDHCQSGTNGGAKVVMEAINTSGAVVDQRCVSGPPGNTTQFAVDLEAPTSRDQTDTIEVRFYGADSRELLGPSTYFQIQTASSGGGDDAEPTSRFEATVNAINVPGRSLVPGADVGVQSTVDSGSEYQITSSVDVSETPRIGQQDYCVGGGLDVVMEVTSDLIGTTKQRKCVTSSADFAIPIQEVARDGFVDTVFVDFYAADSGDLLADTTIFEIQYADSEPDIGDGVTGDFDPNTLEPICNISSEDVKEGEAVTIDVGFEEDLPGGSEARDIEVELLANGQPVESTVTRATRNGVPSVTFEVAFEDGRYDIDFDLTDLGN